MKTASGLLFAALLAVGVMRPTTLAAARDDARILHAIGMVESGMDHRAVGDRGHALGAWQMHDIAWTDANNHRRRVGILQHSRSSWRDPQVQEEMAASFLRLIRQRFAARGIASPTVEQIAVVWNRGWDAARRTGFRSSDYARRVANVYHLQGR